MSKRKTVKGCDIDQLRQRVDAHADQLLAIEERLQRVEVLEGLIPEGKRAAQSGPRVGGFTSGKGAPMKASKEVVERAAKKIWGRVGLPISECRELAESALEAAMEPVEKVPAGCDCLINLPDGAWYGLIRLEE